ncbi:MAG TPA: uracil-DNA glycosylase [Rhodospirillales bacterium]|nr:uracil-DNA glycosylase [Rhodospirillales bacterium]
MAASPETDCRLCSRLVDFRYANRDAHPGWHNGSVPSFGDRDAPLLIVGLAPGLKGANRTGRPFTGDFAGDLLYETLKASTLARGDYGRKADDGLSLISCRITNAVRCVPPANRPTAAEVAACRRFLAAEIDSMANLKVILALGTVAHGAVVAAVGEKKSAWKFTHHAFHHLPRGLVLADSYHCSRYNTNTGRLTRAMFEAVFADIVECLGG